jgi:hypothetical protein
MPFAVANYTLSNGTMIDKKAVECLCKRTVLNTLEPEKEMLAEN